MGRDFHDTVVLETLNSRSRTMKDFQGLLSFNFEPGTLQNFQRCKVNRIQFVLRKGIQSES